MRYWRVLRKSADFIVPTTEFVKAPDYASALDAMIASQKPGGKSGFQFGGYSDVAEIAESTFRYAGIPPAVNGRQSRCVSE